MQLTLMAAHPQALRHEVAEMEDVVEMFGDVAMQARFAPMTLTPSLTLASPCRHASQP